MKRRTIFASLILALLATAPLSFAQQVTLSTPLRYVHSYSLTGPLFSLQHAVGATGNLQEWNSTTGVPIMTVGPTGLATVGTSGSYKTLDMAATQAGYSVFATSPMAVATALRGIEARVVTTGGTHPNDGFLQAGRFAATMNTGTVSLEEVWGVNSTNELNAGTTHAAYGVAGDLFIGTGVTIDGAINSGVFGLYGQSWVHSGVTLTNNAQDIATAGVINSLTGRRKADAAVAAILQGALNQSTAGVLAGFKVYDSNTGANFDYGLDLVGYPATYSNVFNSADIRLSSRAEIMTGTGVPAGGLCTATNLGAIYLNHGGGGGTSLYACEVAGAWAAK